MKTQENTKSSFGLRKNDLVQVMVGRDKGKTGKILGINKSSGRVTVEKVNMVKRHVKPTQKNPGGGIVEKETAIHYSNVQLMCSKCNRGVRFGVQVAEKTKAGTAKKIRVCKRCDTKLDAA